MVILRASLNSHCSGKDDRNTKEQFQKIPSAFTIPRKTTYLECVVKYRLLIECGKSWEGEKNCVPFVYRILVYHASYYDSSNILVEQEPVPSLLQHMHIASLVQYL